jgi:hypothetical protein
VVELNLSSKDAGRSLAEGDADAEWRGTIEGSKTLV